MAQYRSPAPLNFSEPKWDAWKASFMTFRLVTKLHKESEDIQIASLKYCMGAEAEDMMKTFELSTEEAGKFDTVLKKFDEYFKPQINIIRLRRLFQRRTQESNETEEMYLRALFVAAEDCEFGNLKKERIRDQFIAGILDEKLAGKLEHLYLSNRETFTLELVTEYTRSYWDIKEGRKLERCAMDEVNFVKSTGILSRPTRMSSQEVDGACGYCGIHHPKGSAQRMVNLARIVARGIILLECAIRSSIVVAPAAL